MGPAVAIGGVKAKCLATGPEGGKPEMGISAENAIGGGAGCSSCLAEELSCSQGLAGQSGQVA